MMKRYKLFFILILIVGSQYSLGHAQQNTGLWSPVQQIPDYDLLGRAPVMVADQQKNVHAFNDQQVGERREVVIFHRIWNHEQGWGAPVDVVYRGIGANVVVLDSIIDENNVLHLIYFEGDPRSAAIYHVFAPVEQANQTRAWSDPEMIADGAGPVASGVIESAGPGNLIVLYSGQLEGNGLYEVRTEDGGVAWSDPGIIFLTGDDEQWVAALKTHMDEQQRLHAVWGVVNSRGVGEAVYYAASEPDGQNWSRAIPLATRDEGEYSTTWPTVITDRNGQVIVVYQDGTTATRFMRLSKDAGKTWDPPVRPFPYIGEYEHAILAKDSNQNLHMVIGNRLAGSPDIHGMWYSKWEDNRWSDLEPIISAPRADSFDPSAPQAIISQGNVLLAAWWNNVPGEFLNGVWYSSKVLDAPELPTLVPPSSTVTSVAIITPSAVEMAGEATSSAMITPAGGLPIEGENLPATGDSNPAMTIIISLLPVILIFILIVLSRSLFNRGK